MSIFDPTHHFFFKGILLTNIPKLILLLFPKVIKFFNFQTRNDLQESLSRLSRSAKVINKKLQPRPVIVGPLKKIEASYVSINDQLFPALNPINAVETMLKCYYALNCEYPPEAANIWRFSALAVYDLQHRPVLPSVTSLNSLVNTTYKTLSEKSSVQN